MIRYENLIINGKQFVKAYSDTKHYIQKVGTNEIYSEAVDLAYLNYTYIETDEVIQDDKSENN